MNRDDPVHQQLPDDLFASIEAQVTTAGTGYKDPIFWRQHVRLAVAAYRDAPEEPSLSPSPLKGQLRALEKSARALVATIEDITQPRQNGESASDLLWTANLDPETHEHDGTPVNADYLLAVRRAIWPIIERAVVAEGKLKPGGHKRPESERTLFIRALGLAWERRFGSRPPSPGRDGATRHPFYRLIYECYRAAGGRSLSDEQLDRAAKDALAARARALNLLVSDGAEKPPS